MKEIIKKLKTFIVNDDNLMDSGLFEPIVNMEIDLNNKGTIAEKDFNEFVKAMKSVTDVVEKDMKIHYREFLLNAPNHIKRNNDEFNFKNNNGQVNISSGNSTVNATHNKY